MKNYSISKQLIKSTKNFLSIEYYTLIDRLRSVKGIYYGWGRKASGLKAVALSQKYQSSCVLLEDGFIRSVGLGIHKAPSFSLIEDDVGIYYDATTPSRLENILNTYDFMHDAKLIAKAKEAILLIREYHISKYNSAKDIDEDFLRQAKFGKSNILIIAQTMGDASLAYGMSKEFSTDDMIQSAINENPHAEIYLKIHPDVLSGKKKSDIDIATIKQKCEIIDQDINPISLLKYFSKVYTKTSGMGFEALLLGKECVCFGMPFYAGWGLTDDRTTSVRRKRKRTVEEIFAAAYILYSKYYNPYSQKQSDVIDTIKTIHTYRNLYRENEGSLYLFGFSGWKRRFTVPFFSSFKKSHIIFCTTLEHGLKKGLSDASKIYVWGKKPFYELEQYAKERNIALHRVEDGFIRSVSLGSDLTKPYSLVVDSRGIYFDPSEKSDLEHILTTHDFDTPLIQRAKNLQHYLLENRISKYNIYQDKKLELKGLIEGQKIIMATGQVEDDASIIYGAEGMTNLELLQACRKNAKDAYIIYKPHPDVLVGNRKGNIEKEEALKYCNIIISEASIDSVLEWVDEVHTMTSLVGFEALMRGKKVTTYGLPFYAGWGLTTDTKVISRRECTRTLEELIAATLILYPRYIHPKTNTFCEVEVVLAEIDKEKNRYNDDSVYRALMNGRNFISRKAQFVLKGLKGE